MVQLCPRCHRPNPSTATFCHFDGAILHHGAAPPAVFPREFLFPSGRRCRSFDELVHTCYSEWDDARRLLHDGTFTTFLGSMGRADLVRAAREAQAQPDPDIALTNFLAALPATQVQGPKLNLHPRRLSVGPLHVGEQRPVQLHLTNDGRGVLQGKVTIAEGTEWLRFPSNPDPTTLELHAPRDLSLSLHLDTTGLIVGQNYAGKLVVVTNGGVAEVPVRLDLAARPFPHSPYHGAQSPHELARKMRDNPHPAVALLHSDDVVDWFAANGWAYPIAGTPAPGLAAVQQFFEELGLARAPRITLSQDSFHHTCTVPERLVLQVVIRSPERKLVHGRAQSDVTWMIVNTPTVSGQGQAAITVTIDSAMMPENKSYHATLKVVANAGQTFPVRIQVDVTGNKTAWFGGRKSTQSAVPIVTPPPPPLATPVPNWLPATPPPPLRRRSGAVGQRLIVGAVLGLSLRLLLVIPEAASAATHGVAWFHEAGPDVGLLRLLLLAAGGVGALVGLVLVWRSNGRITDLVCGLLAGTVAGLAAGATLGSALLAGDSVPRAILTAAGLPTAFRVPAAIVVWTLLGGVGGVVMGLFGSTGRSLLGGLASPLAGVARGLRMHGLARVFEIGGT